jgi:hypothetical protein
MKMAVGFSLPLPQQIKRFVMEGYSANLKLSTRLRKALTKSGEKFGAKIVDIPPLLSQAPWFLVS